MKRRRKIALEGMALILLASMALAVLVIQASLPRQVTSITGVVLRQDPDPRKRQPIEDAQITTTSTPAGSARSDASGFFHLALNPGVSAGAAVNLLVRHPEYKDAERTIPAGEALGVVRMQPSGSLEPAPAEAKGVLANVRVRYAVKSTTTVNVGSIVRTFEVPNAANVPCKKGDLCSPDGKWKAARATPEFDAGDANAFRNPRVSCIAGPCPFTKIETGELPRSARRIRVSVLNWSETATFLFEADVTHTMESDIIRQAYPAIFGEAMNFTLPPTAQGPSIEAEMNGQDIVFPVGPKLALSWAMCSMKQDPDHTKVYRCELKPGYRFEVR